MFTANIDRTYDIDIATMWSLWTNPLHAANWFRPSLEQFGPTVATIDLQVGGIYRIEMIRTTGEVHTTTGTIVELDEPQRLAFTWRWDGTDQESLVEVTFTEVDAKTTVAIRHTRLTSQEDADRHAEGWIGCLESIALGYRPPTQAWSP
ncbi:SRPBCC domain-containing protein [Agromyces sp. SYSU K20354]|uniref:SRPBCC family protein n=1 Tax=Agromyces cavernae TaxID=2898659 RepID=UPI001E512B7F|nr:SRPBCC domain-containing protein [Agromyces cavernae]MCD2440978.1 SRPBCC domain-containing protein [Agromyces cavernae]